MNDNPDNARMTEIKGWIELEREHLRALERQIGPLLEEQAIAKERLGLLERLRDTFAAGKHDVASLEPIALQPAPKALEEAAEEVLRSAGRPMHVSRIRRELVKRGVAIPGQGLDANVITRLARSPRFVRVARGTYSLAEGTR